MGGISESTSFGFALLVAGGAQFIGRSATP
jgi:hypothetical protein